MTAPVTALRRLGSNAAVLAGSQIASQVAIFVRNLLVVRALSPPEYGVAATFLLALTLGQSFANLSIGTLVVQAPDGEEPSFQRTAQFAQAFQGFALGLLLFLGAPLIGYMFQTPDAVWCYQMLGVAAVAQGLIHFDPTRYKRRDRFAPQAGAELFAELASLAFVAVGVHFIHDYTIAMWAVICQNCALAVSTHVLAERRYGWAWERSFATRILSFGWPMLMSSILLYVVMQGDRFLVGSAATLTKITTDWLGAAWQPARVFDKTDLALFSIAVSITLMPTTLIARVIGNMVFPALARNQADPARFRRVYSACAVLNAIAGTSAAVFFILAGENATALIYTESYRGVGAFIGWLGVIQALRILRGSLQGASLAMGDSQLPLWSLAARMVVVPVAVWVTITGGSLADLALTSVAGECVSLGVALIGLNRRFAMPFAILVPPVLFNAAVLAGAFLADTQLPAGHDLLAIALGVLGSGAVPLFGLAAFPGLRAELWGLVRPPGASAPPQPAGTPP